MNFNSSQKVGLVYDEQMACYHHLWVPDYPECPDRLRAPLDRCKQYGLIDRCQIIKPRKAAEEEVLRMHSMEYFQLLKQTAHMKEEELKSLSMKFDGIYFHPKSFDAAMLSAGCAIEAMESVLSGEVQFSFAMIRPPGHHAMKDEANGYCYLNNVALAAAHARAKHNLRRILIVDWDVHHGQGTQSFFYDDPSVLFFSCHRYEHGKFWPNLRKSDYDFVGAEEGRGFNANVPVNETGLKDGDYLAIFQQILMPIAFEFQPELVLVSCGFDAAIGDPESLNRVTPACFAHLTHMLKEISRNICFVFEGGYCLKSLAECTALTLRTLLDDPCPQLAPIDPPLESTKQSILNSIRVLRPFWKCLQFQSDDDSNQSDDSIHLDTITPKDDVTFVDIRGPNDVYDLNAFEKMSLEDVEMFDRELDELIQKSILILPPNRTCIAYDDIMLQHKQISGNHPEQPERIKRIMKKLKELKMLERCKILESRKATFEELNLVHDSEYIREVEEWSKLNEDELNELSQSDLSVVRSIYLSKATFECASMSVGCALNVVDEVASGKSRNGFAIVRPPGHHAERNQANGFCFFNTVAIAAKYCQKQHNLKRIMIVDWDVHHGNGTQQTFYDDPSVLVISIHRRDGGNFYPVGDENSVDQLGEGEGVGFNINIPWSKRRQGDAEYMAAFQQIIMPVAYEFSPDLVLVSAGFDAAAGDPLGGCDVSPDMFGHMTHMLSSLASGRLVLILEGGYNLNSLSTSAASCVSVLLGDPLPSVHLSSINDKAARTIREVMSIHRKYWKCLSFHANLPSRDNTLRWLDEQMDRWESVKFDSGTRNVVREALRHVRDACPILDRLDLNSLPPPTTIRHVVELRSDGASNAQQAEAAGGAFGSASCAALGVGGASGVVVGVVDGAGAASETFSLVDEEFINILSQLALGEDSLQLHAVQPLEWCPHLDSLARPFTGTIDTNASCSECSEAVENWICLSCSEVFCSRFRNGHMVEHNGATSHPLVLSFSDLSVWCYECQAYVDNQILRSYKEAAYLDKFHCHMP